MLHRHVFILGLVLAPLTACGVGKAPIVPEAGSTASGTSSTGTGDAQPAQTTTTTTGDAQGATAETADANASDPRLGALPMSLRNNVITCEGTGKFYDIGAQVCTDTALATFPCTVDSINAQLDPSTVQPFADYLANKAKDMTIYECTVDDVNVNIHFYRNDQTTVVYRKLSVAKKK